MSDRLVWIDCEMTGLDLARDQLIEIAAVVTDSDLTVLDEGIDLIIHADGALLDSMVDVVAAMHAASGLTEQARAETRTVAEAEQQVLAYLRQHVTEPRSVPLCGNSIATDRSFLARDMTELDGFLHYRMIDVSSVKELARRWYPRAYFALPAKGMAHRALADILESIEELRYYRRTVFVPPPGPTTDEAAAVAAEVTAVRTSRDPGEIG
ncbi:MAG: oligoribonuclease [Geodermatophilaceae bacterium]|nr:oligoribonuclease [Geodermatophilaceae bacterium]MDQ3454187.1 oligoribonuclease [Actinomycetota bacterium]